MGTLLISTVALARRTRGGVEPKFTAPWRREVDDLHGRAMEEQGQQLHKVAQHKAVSLLHPEDVGCRENGFSLLMPV